MTATVVNEIRREFSADFFSLFSSLCHFRKQRTLIQRPSKPYWHLRSIGNSLLAICQVNIGKCAEFSHRHVNNAYSKGEQHLQSEIQDYLGSTHAVFASPPLSNARKKFPSLILQKEVQVALEIDLKK